MQEVRYRDLLILLPDYLLILLIICSSPDPDPLSPRLPAAPKEAHMVSTKDNEPQVLGPIPFEFMA